MGKAVQGVASVTLHVGTERIVEQTPMRRCASDEIEQDVKGPRAEVGGMGRS